MAMAIGAGERPGEEADVMSEINTTPLIDVMLVLLIMLIITIPIPLHSVNLDLPAGQAEPAVTPPQVVRIDIRETGGVVWNDEVLTDREALNQRLQLAAVADTAPELQIRPDKQAPYHVVVAVMAAIQEQGLTRVGLQAVKP